MGDGSASSEPSSTKRRWRKRQVEQSEAPAPPEASDEGCNKSVCIVGAGIAALVAAKHLRKHGFSVRVFGYCGKNEDGSGEKLGGRLYTEPWDLQSHKMQGPWKVSLGTSKPASTIRFDAGCQFFTATDPTFNAEVSEWQKAGVVKPWESARVGCVTADGTCSLLEPDTLPDLLCGDGGMTQIIEHLTREIGPENVVHHIAQRVVRGSQRRYAIEYEEVLTASSYLDFVGGNLPQDTAYRRWTEEFDYIVLAQGLAVNQPRMVNFEDDAAQSIIECLKRNVRFQNILTLTLVFRRKLPIPADIFVTEDCQEIALVVHTSSKPGFSNAVGYDVWTVFSSPEFARNYALPKRKGAALSLMKEAFFTYFHIEGMRGQLLSPEGTPFGLLWPHGRCTTCPAANVQALFHDVAGVALCGDCFAGGPGLQATVISAVKAAEAIVAHRKGFPMPPNLLTDLDAPWQAIQHAIPWVISHYPGLPPPPSCKACDSTPVVSQYCCPTHDWLGSHPGLVFGRSAALGPSGKGKAVRECDDAGGKAAAKGKGKRSAYQSKGKVQSKA